MEKSLRDRVKNTLDFWVLARIKGPRQTGTGTVGYSDSWVQGQLGTGTNGYRCDSWVQGQTGTSGATNGYRDKRVQGCDKRVQGQSGTSATNGYSVVCRYIRTCV